MYATIRETTGYTTDGTATLVPAGVYKVGDSNDEWTSIRTTKGFVAIKTVDILNTSDTYPKDNKPPTKAGWDLGFEWQLPKAIKKIAQFFADVFNISKDIVILVFWVILALFLLSLMWKSRPTRVRVVD